MGFVPAPGIFDAEVFERTPSARKTGLFLKQSLLYREGRGAPPAGAALGALREALTGAAFAGFVRAAPAPQAERTSARRQGAGSFIFGRRCAGVRRWAGWAGGGRAG